jgi:hypothetical protein
MRPPNKRRQSAKSTAPGAKRPEVRLRDGKKNPKSVGVSRRLWAMSDTIPVAIRMIF